MTGADWCHLEDLPVNEFDPIVLAEDTQLSESMIIIDRESVPSWLYWGHGRHDVSCDETD
jgi:hypothetical protein